MGSFDRILDILGAIPDHRRAEGQLYKLKHILLFSILAVVTGANSYRGIRTFIQVHRQRLNEVFGLSWKRAPAHTAIRYIYLGLDPDAVEQAFRRHAESLNALKPEVAPETPEAKRPLRAIAIDGKTLRGSFNNIIDRKAAQVLGAFATDTALILAHVEIDEKSNEIPAAQNLLEELKVSGHTITLDALHCQKNISK